MAYELLVFSRYYLHKTNRPDRELLQKGPENFTRAVIIKNCFLLFVFSDPGQKELIRSLR